MNKKKIIMKWNKEEYELIPTVDHWIGLISVDIKKVTHPNRKFFRTTLVKIKNFNLNDFDSIEEGCRFCFSQYVAEYKKYLALQEKIDKFYK